MYSSTRDTSLRDFYKIENDFGLIVQFDSTYDNGISVRPIQKMIYLKLKSNEL